MNSAKFLVSTLIAAAAMTATAYAEVSTGQINATGLWDNDASTYLTATKDSVGQYYFKAQGTTLSGDIIIGGTDASTDSTKGLIVTDSNQGSQTLDGVVTGVGILAIKASTGYNTSQLIFSGDVSGFSGLFYVNTSNAHTLTFAGTSESAIAGTAEIVSNKAVVFDKSSGSFTVANSSITAGELKFQGGASYTVTGAVTAGTLTLSAGTLNLTGGESTINGTYSGEGAFNVNDGAVLVMVGNNSSTNQTAGEITINGGGTVKITGHDLMGWGGSANTAFVLAGASSEKVATLCVAENNGQILTLSRSVEMRGNAVLSSENGSGFNTYGGSLSISGTNNIVSSKILLRNAFEVSVAEAGEAEISGNISEHGDGSNGFTKSGLGKLTLSGDNIYGCGLTVGAGTLAISGRADDVDSITVAENAILDLSGATVSLTSAISNEGTVEVSSGTVFKLLSSNSTDGTYSVINNSGTGSITNWDSTTLGTSNFVIDGDVVTARSSVDFSTAGVVTITGGGAISLNWVGTDGTGTWNTASTNTPWADSESNAQFFADKDSVTFNTSGASVTVDGTVKPNAMTVSANTTFSGSGEIILAAPGNLAIGSSATLSLGDDVVLDLGSSAEVLDLSHVSGEGTVKYTHTNDDGGSSGLVTSAGFTGLVDYVGNLNWSDTNKEGQVTIGNDEMILRLSARSGKTDGIWGKFDKTFRNDIEFGSDYKIYLGNANLTFAGDVDAGENKLTLEGANTVTFSGDLTVKELYSSGGSVVIGNGSDASLAVVSRVEAGDSASGGSMSLKIESGATLKITGDNNGSGYKGASLLLGEWTQSTQLEVSGTLLARNAKALVGDNNMTITVADGGVLALKGIGIADTSANKADKSQGITLNINEGGKMLLGDGGISSSKTWSGTVGAGVIGTYSDSGTTISNDLELTSTTGTTFDTQKYIFADDGNSISRGSDEGSISMAGVLSGIGKLIKDGAGTLKLSGNNTYSGGTTISAGKLSALHENALGGGAVSIANGAELNLHTSVTVAGLNGESGAKITAEQNGYTLEVAGGGEFAGNIAPGGVQVNLVKSGAVDSVLTISGSRVNGDTEIRSGTLVAASENALGSGPLKLNGGTFGTSLDAFSVAGAVELGEGTTSTINTSKYANGAFGAGEASITIANALSGSGALTVTGTEVKNPTTNLVSIVGGTLTLAGTNSNYSGNITVSSGTLVAQNAYALGSGNISVGEHGTLELSAGATLNNLSNLGTVQAAEGSTEAQTWTLNVDEGMHSYSGFIDGSEAESWTGLHKLEKTGRGLLSIMTSNDKGASVYVKSLAVREGIVELVSGKSRLGTGYEFGGNYADVSVASDATLRIVAGTEAIKTENLNLATGSLLVVDLKDVQAAGETITLNIVSAEAINLGASVEGVALATADVPAIEDFVRITGDAHLSDYVKQTWTLSDNTLSLTLAIPEPSLFGLLAGLGALTLVGTRRRKKA